ncbi:hypothetical protein B0H10DRAFT_503896 [Mycena sp. CBHHK59/15]|nr:hypothetical protein B0H10DRAFT_503896 [Mycena sp. CBHHK59/15]
MGEFDTTIGFTLVGILLNTFLWGVNMSQFTSYWGSPKDPLWVRLGIMFLFVLNAAQAATVLYMAWFYCVLNFNNPSVVATSLWPYPFTAFTTAIIALINQLFQTYRIYKFIPNKPLVGLLVVAILATCGMGIAAAIQSWIFSELAKLVSLQPVVEANLALQTTVDVGISIILSFSFARSKTDFKNTNQVLNLLIRGAVQSGIFTSIFALGTLLSFRFSPGTYMIALFAVPIGRIYVHTILDHLVGREELRNMLSNSGARINVNVHTTVDRSGGSESIALRNQTLHRKDSLSVKSPANHDA